jgi:hypothetical protein
MPHPLRETEAQRVGHPRYRGSKARPARTIITGIAVLAWIFLLTILILGIMSLVRQASRRRLAPYTTGTSGAGSKSIEAGRRVSRTSKI